mmetsp:Transcript_100461/g.199475  ORF Transcript_100461/g.199475 Transcript_100461/m.199475 type:complete len:131 (-) Transcript_100461:1261-1653(-)
MGGATALVVVDVVAVQITPVGVSTATGAEISNLAILCGCGSSAFLATVQGGGGGGGGGWCCCGKVDGETKADAPRRDNARASRAGSTREVVVVVVVVVLQRCGAARRDSVDAAKTITDAPLAAVGEAFVR